MVMERFGRYWNGWDDIRTLLKGYRNVTTGENSAWVGRQKLERLRMLPDRYAKGREWNERATGAGWILVVIYF